MPFFGKKKEHLLQHLFVLGQNINNICFKGRKPAFVCNMSNISFFLCICVTQVSMFYANTRSLQVVCEEIRRLAPKVGLHHDGVVFGSDDFCASIGSYSPFCWGLSVRKLCFTCRWPSAFYKRGHLKTLDMTAWSHLSKLLMFLGNTTKDG